MENASTEVYLALQSTTVKEGAEHLPVVLSTKNNMDTDKLIPVVNLPRVRFIGGPTRQVITESIKGAWDP